MGGPSVHFEYSKDLIKSWKAAMCFILSGGNLGTTLGDQSVWPRATKGLKKNTTRIIIPWEICLFFFTHMGSRNMSLVNKLREISCVTWLQAWLLWFSALNCIQGKILVIASKAINCVFDPTSDESLFKDGTTQVPIDLRRKIWYFY